MVIIAVLVGLFVLFFFVRHHTGPAHLAMIAGLSVYEMFGKNATEWLSQNVNQIPADISQAVVYILLILVFPLILYLRSHRGGMRGILRIAEAVVFSCIMTALLSATIAKFVTFDTISTNISQFISSIEGTLVLIGVISAYVDLLFFRNK